MRANHQRTKNLQHQLEPHQAILLSTPSDIEYFSAFEFLVPEEREAFFLVTKNNAFLIYAHFSPLPDKPFYQVLENCRAAALAGHIQSIARQENITQLLFDASSLFVEEFLEIEKKIHSSEPKVSLLPLNKDLIWNVRMKKDSSEMTKILSACTVAAQAFETVFSQLKIGMTEKEVSDLLENEMKALGASGPAFPTIVAFGAHGALPHYQPGETVLEENMPVLIDWGAKVSGYRSDMTRSFWFGPAPDPEFTKIENLVKEAYRHGLEKLQKRNGQTVIAKDIDTATRSFIAEAGFADQFIHTSGHGIGLDIHEPPSLSWRNELPLTPQMVITIEPGIYLEGKFGYRYENTVLVTDSGAQELTVL